MREDNSSKKDIYSVAEKALAAMNELTRILEEETKAVNKADIEAVRGLFRRKNTLSLECQKSFEELVANPGELKSAPDDLKEKLKKANMTLAEVSARNAKALIGAVNATQRVIQHVIKTVKDEAMPSNGYSDLRNPAAELGKYSPTCVPVAVIRVA